MIGADNIYCHGNDACEHATFENVTSNVFISGYNAGEDVSFTNVMGNIYCISHYSCYGTTFTNSLLNVYGIINKIYLIGLVSGGIVSIQNVIL